jgi:RNA polymerase sigma factor (sigma-70 family)
MGTAGDMQLVREYACQKCEDSFAILVSPHINMVYSVALREVRNAHNAEEITQAVFLALSRKAASLRDATVVSAWLFQTTRLTAANFKRSEMRRTRRDQEAFMQSTLEESGEDLWRKIGPTLNDAIAGLAQKERDALLLRFMEGKNLKEVGVTLGVTEEAAKKRVARAVEKLRRFFSAHGVAVSTDGLGGAMQAHSVQVAPSALAAAIIAQAFNQTAVTSSTFMLIKTTMKLMTWAKMKAALVASAVAVLAVGTVGFITAASGSADAQKTDEKAKVENAAPAVQANSKVLVFRDQPSWRRKPDFEDVLTEQGLKFEVSGSADMEGAELSPYAFVIIPGSQPRDYYEQYVANAARFDKYVTSGGTLVLELNGAEDARLPLPGGVRMVKHPALDNQIMLPDHPVLQPFSEKKIHANYASHGYLEAVPPGALILVTEIAGGQPASDRPTFVEYRHGKGRVLAACQCFHDRDKSGRGVLMPTLISYAAEKEWYLPKKNGQ